ncbi:dipeptidase [Parabacteroides sp. PF5-5]|uniref:dipeptidase n=1 Tax=unclassified Parabacteroides TaxID=2649774 RepID=UPI0024733997|nr:MULTISPECIES: C69 family dipeptidase [unclassified Parabacteroides]MDH6303480.1 dipeptidase [Parabacteroides sp. PH5-39]MDH6314802.1 dipeptidase [Parabacteroides sp. PF5-13]MDH6318139.1 dipeptidase [Parabacteroides sp. PH5-13]MDH6321929.1 dipeptidase [Parabacteroides sp. PH5-8]MDH6326053.1 dipeptidase [Parabacteroides sp. PH5-41]
MTKTITLFLILFCIGFTVNAQATGNDHPESCTSIMVGKKASSDGSVMTSHTCDGNYRTWMNMVPAKTYDRDTVTGIYTGKMHTEFADDQTKVVLKGSIPQVRSTYRFLNTAYPCLNEKQLAIGETTITGRKELVNDKGVFMIEELQRIALERCKTAREAIALMGKLIAEYGYADWGECLTIADTKEVWHFEVFGEGKDKVGGVWAAIRIPDDHVGVSANIPRISKLNLKDKENCMASTNVYDVAKTLGYWDGKEPFCFWKAYGGGKKAFNIREYFILSYLAPSLNLSYDAEELPFSVKPEKQVAVTDVMALLRQTYEGTKWDMTQNLKVEVKKKDSDEKETIVSPAANPWMTMDMVNMLNAIEDSTVVRYRLVSVPQCSYSHVIQLRDWLPDAIGGVAWMSFDNPGQSPRFPIFCGNTTLPSSFNICGQHRYREDATIWTYRRANKLATVKWGMTKDIVNSAVSHFEKKGQAELSFVESQYTSLLQSVGEEEAAKYLDNYTFDFTGATLYRWKEMGDTFWKMFARGF